MKQTSAPAAQLMGDSGPAVGSALPDDALDAAALAKRYGLSEIGVRPPLGTYLKQMWKWRSFVTVLATSRAASQNKNSYLGQAWSVLTPTLNAIVYVVIFGIVLGASRGVENSVAFIVSGTFMYRFFGDAVTSGARSMQKEMGLVRSLHFPRAVVPLSSTMSELATLIPELLVMLIFIHLAGLINKMVPVAYTWRLVLLIPAVILLYAFSAGVGLALARLVAFIPDFSNVIGFVLRFVMYGSGVLFPVSHYVGNPQISLILDYQPVAVYLNLARQAVLNEPTIPLDLSLWVWGVGWAVVTFAVGFLIFWRAEARYGRE